MARKPGPERTRPAPARFALPVRGLEPGFHPFLTLLPKALESPALPLIGTHRFPAREVMRAARVQVIAVEGYCWIDDARPCIVLTRTYYQQGSDLDLYLDLLHEVTHLRQLLEGRDLWDDNLPYHRRPTEIEGYAVAVAEMRRLGLDGEAIRQHLTNPWMTTAQVTELIALIDVFLGSRSPGS